MTDDEVNLASFLLEAKRRTYAGLDDDATVATPLLSGSKQLEYQAAPYAYRDIYFGMAFFVGQETVAKDGRVVWSMGYSGGVSSGIDDRGLVLSIYKFLRQALLSASAEAPYRGPRAHVDGDLRYANVFEGALPAFHGVEEVSKGGVVLYRLRYGGGILR